MARRLVSSGSPYEKPIGFSRAVRVGNRVYVSGTGPIAEDGSTACPNDAYGQAKRCLTIIQRAVSDAGGALKHVVRTRMYLTDLRVWEEVAKAHGEFFCDIRPAATMIVVAGLVREDWLVEIEAEAVLESD